MVIELKANVNYKYPISYTPIVRDGHHVLFPKVWYVLLEVPNLSEVHFKPTGASCLIPPPNRKPIPAAMITKVVFIFFLFPLFFISSLLSTYPIQHSSYCSAERIVAQIRKLKCPQPQEKLQ